MKCDKCKAEMTKVCDPVTKKCHWECPSCGHKK